MPDKRQQLINEAAQRIRDAGASSVSIIAQWPDKEVKTTILVMSGEGRDPWKDKRAVTASKRALGKGLKEIRRETPEGGNKVLTPRGKL